jgi:hypothetical protein
LRDQTAADASAQTAEHGRADVRSHERTRIPLSAQFAEIGDRDRRYRRNQQPCSARSAIRAPKLGANAQPSVASASTAQPPAMTVR